MSLADGIILLLVAGAALAVLGFMRGRKKAGKSCCGCAGCSGGCGCGMSTNTKEES